MDEGPDLSGARRIRVDSGLAKGGGISGISPVARSIVGLGRADVDQPIHQPTVALGRFRRRHGPSSFEDDLGRHGLDLIPQRRLDPGDQEIARLLGGGHRGRPGCQIADRRALRLSPQPGRLLKPG